ncbi:MAG: UbiA family prenyltransferase [Chitinophagales bacterium]
MGTSNIFLKYIYYPAVKYRIHVSAIFFTLVWTLYNSTQTQVVWPIVWSFGLWHFALYLFDRAYDYDKDIVTQPDEAVKPFEQKFLLYTSITLSIVPIVILLYNNLIVWPYLCFIPITFLYTYPVIGEKRAKNFLIFKNFYSAFFIWTLPLLVIVVFYMKLTHDVFHYYINNFVGLFLYTMAGEALWDIRDVEGDKQFKVKTIPNTFGLVFTKIYIYLLILFEFLFVSQSISDSFLIYCLLLIFINEKSPRWLFHLPPLLAFLKFVIPNLLYPLFFR